MAAEDGARVLVHCRMSKRKRGILKRSLAFSYKAVKHLEFVQCYFEMTFRQRYRYCLELATNETRSYMDKKTEKRLNRMLEVVISYTFILSF